MVKEWGIDHDELENLTMREIQMIALAERAERYIREQKRPDHAGQGGGRQMRSQRNSTDYQDFKERMAN